MAWLFDLYRCGVDWVVIIILVLTVTCLRPLVVVHCTCSF